MTVMEPEPRAPAALQLETIYRCPRCTRLLIPAGIVKRIGALLLVIPFLALIAGALATGAWIVWSMLASGTLEAGFLLVALVLMTAAGFASRPALRTLACLIRRDALLPLARSSSGDHDFSGDL